jgi:hypothetical protein
VTLESTAPTAVEIAPHEETIHAMLQDTLDGETIDNLDEHDPSPRELLGIVPMGEDDDFVSIDDTILDPAHEIWTYGPDGWIDSPQDAEREIEKTLRKLTVNNIFKTKTTKSRGGKPLAMSIEIEDLPE